MKRNMWFWTLLCAIGLVGGFADRYISVEWLFSCGVISMIIFFNLFEKREKLNEKV